MSMKCPKITIGYIIILMGITLHLLAYSFCYAQEPTWIQIGDYNSQEQLKKNIIDLFNHSCLPSRSLLKGSDVKSLLEDKRSEDIKHYESWKNKNKAANQEIIDKLQETHTLGETISDLQNSKSELEGRNKSIQSLLKNHNLRKEEIKDHIDEMDKAFLEKLQQISFRYIILSSTRLSGNDDLALKRLDCIRDAGYKAIKTCNVFIISSETITQDQKVIIDYIQAVIKGSVREYHATIIDDIDIPMNVIVVGNSEFYDMKVLKCYEIYPFIRMPNIPYEDSGFFEKQNAINITPDNLEQNFRQLKINSERLPGIRDLITELDIYNSQKEQEVATIINDKYREIGALHEEVKNIDRQVGIIGAELERNSKELDEIDRKLTSNYKDNSKLSKYIEDKRSEYQKAISTLNLHVTKHRCRRINTNGSPNDTYLSNLPEMAVEAEIDGNNLIAERFWQTNKGKLTEQKERGIQLKPKIKAYKILARYIRSDASEQQCFGLVVTFRLSLEFEHNLQLFSKANICYRESRFNEAVEIYSRIIEMAPDNAPAFNNRGNAKYSTGNINGAKQDFVRAIEIDPYYDNAYHNLGNIYLIQGNINGTLKQLKQAISCNPNKGRYYYTRAGIYCGMKQTNRALEDFDKALTYNPYLWEAFFDRGGLYYEQGKYREAVSDFSKVLELNSQNAKAYFYRANAYLNINQNQQACVDLHHACQLAHQEACRQYVKLSCN